MSGDTLMAVRVLREDVHLCRVEPHGSQSRIVAVMNMNDMYAELEVFDDVVARAEQIANAFNSARQRPMMQEKPVRCILASAGEVSYAESEANLIIEKVQGLLDAHGIPLILSLEDNRRLGGLEGFVRICAELAEPE